MATVLPEFQIPILFIDDSTEEENLCDKEQFIKDFHMHSGCKFIPFDNRKNTTYTCLQNIQAFVYNCLEGTEDVIVLASSEIHITSTNAPINLAQAIVESHSLGAKLLVTGIKDFQDAIYLKNHLYWVNKISSFSLIFIFKDLFRDILALEDSSFSDSIGVELSRLTSNKFILHPFIVDEACTVPPNLGKFPDKNNTIRPLDKIASIYNTICEIHPFLPNSRSSPQLNGIFSDKILANLSNKFLIPVEHESRIVVIVPFHNPGYFLKECIDSLLTQQYGNFEIILLDDCSTDETTISVIRSLESKVTVIRSEVRKFALENIANCLVDFTFFDQDIVLLVDGDDYLYHDQVFSMINSIYYRTSCLLTYGQYYSTSNRTGHCRAYSEKDFKILRKLDWRASHLKTFKYKLFSEVILQDREQEAFKDINGNFYEMTYDIALMIPLMEVAGFRRCYFNDQVNYIYRIHNQNDAARNWKLQVNTENEIKQKEEFKCMFG